MTVNGALDVDQYPLPKPTDLFTTLAAGQTFTKLDLSQAYQQLLLDENSRKYITINTHQGLYEHIRLPLGIAASASAFFQKAMDLILQGVPPVACYIDDILITGANQQEHLQNLRELLDRLNLHNLQITKAKCEFMKQSVEYLGHSIDSQGLHTMPAKVEAIQQTPELENVQQLRSFLNFYGKFFSQHYLSAQPTFTKRHKVAIDSKLR